MEKKKKLRALGITCGAGSMLIGAKKAGFDIVGNIEWRKYYHTGTFEKNFPKAFMVKSISDLPEIPKDIDLVMGHPECGNWSKLNLKKEKAFNDPSDIPLFKDLVNVVNPKCFVMDNLPRSIETFTPEWWRENMPNYDLKFERVNNWKYGNIQRHRVRLFVIGSRKDIKWEFESGEKENNLTVRDVIGDLPFEKDLPEINHVHVNPKAKTCFISPKTRKKLTYKELAYYFLHPEKIKKEIEGLPKKHSRNFPQVFKGQVWNLPSINKKGEIVARIGKGKLGWDYTSFTLDGGENHFHPETGYPLTIRERARIQGCPDNFIFCGEYHKQVRQTGKFMPVQFCEYVAKEVKNHLLKNNL